MLSIMTGLLLRCREGGVWDDVAKFASVFWNVSGQDPLLVGAPSSAQNSS
jgi:hypothetical protein